MDYVVGYMREQLSDRVLMVRKSKPAWQAGLLNGIGGKVDQMTHVEPLTKLIGNGAYGDEFIRRCNANRPETPVEAMVREFKEETGIETTADDWRSVLSLHDKNDFYTCNPDGSHGMVHWFAAQRRLLPKFPGKNDRGEELVTVRVCDVAARSDMVATSRWCISMAFLDPSCPPLWGGLASGGLVERGGHSESAGPNAASASNGCPRNLGPGAGAAGSTSEPLPPLHVGDFVRHKGHCFWDGRVRDLCGYVVAVHPETVYLRLHPSGDYSWQLRSDVVVAPDPKAAFKIGDKVRGYTYGMEVRGEVISMSDKSLSVLQLCDGRAACLPRCMAVLDHTQPDIVYRYFGSSVFCNRNKCQAGIDCEECRELKASALPPMQEQRSG